jgi:hypothetical protein
MISTIGTIVGGVFMLVGLLWGLVAWIGKKVGLSQKQIEDTLRSIIEQLQPKDQIDSPMSGKTEPTKSTRIDALQSCESLARYLESRKNDAGLQALQQVVTAIFSQP